jgi:uncharacterized membrane protein
MRRFSFGPTLALRGRKFKGLRGLAGKPFHPPLTDIPVTAYLFGAVFDVLSTRLHAGHPEVAEQLYRAGTWVFIGGVAVSLLTALTGWADWYRSSQPGTQARRTINSHAIIMIVVSVLAIVDLVLRLTTYGGDVYAPLGLTLLSVVVAVAVTIGATYGGTLVYDYGFNVETASDSPVWHENEQDVYPGQKAP